MQKTVIILEILVAIASLVAWVYLFMTHTAIASALFLILWQGNIQVSYKINRTLKEIIKVMLKK